MYSRRWSHPQKVVGAIGFHGGRVLAAGTVDQVAAKMTEANKNYDTVRLSRGQTLLPGFIRTFP